ncbi:MAG: hypothetical protein ISS56_07990 [Anaerolineae bacterium]|nr:hypothetical protein [Anaerolineae bacterium]
MDKHTAYFNILNALPATGCVVCRLGHNVEVNYIKDVLYSKTTSVRTRAELREARGFCITHARQLDQIGHALGLSLIYQDILITLQDVLQQHCPQRTPSRRAKRQLANALAPQAECPACAYRAGLEQVYVETLLDHVVEQEFVAEVRAADPLCLNHFRHAIEESPSLRQLHALCDSQLAHWERLIAELGEFVRKNDYRFHDEVIGPEGTAWLCAIDAIAGTRTF